ncbi:MAG TPA: hypothetical protein VFN87_19210 [Solirubrobacteraceae bacterium]|nr:hypothetical protein [Solirubrobacteraceae bacterium]
MSTEPIREVRTLMTGAWRGRTGGLLMVLVGLAAGFGACGVLVARAQGGATVQATEGQQFTGQVATVTVGQCSQFTDANRASATVSWGDGSTSPATLSSPSGGELVISGSHTYAEEGTYDASVSGSWTCNVDTGTAYPFSAAFTVQVTDAALSVTAVGISATAGQQFAGTVATFADGDPGGTASDYTATIDWGDGTAASAGTVRPVLGTPGGFAVTASHTYARANDYFLTVTVADAGGSRVSVNTSASVGQGAPPPPPQSSCPSPPGSWEGLGVVGIDYALADPAPVVGPAGQQTGAFSQTLRFGGADNDIFELTTQGCWQYAGDPQPGSGSRYVEHFGTFGPVNVNGVYLVPVDQSSPPELVVGTDGSLEVAGGHGLYDIQVPTSTAKDAPLATVGRVDLGATPFVWDMSSGHLGSFGPSPQGPAFGHQGITGGDIWITTRASSSTTTTPSAHVAAYLPLPGAFSVAPSAGGPPTGELDYDVSGADVTTGTTGAGQVLGGPSANPCQIHPPCPPIHFMSLRRPLAPADPSAQSVHLTVPDLYLGGLHIQHAFLDYDPASDLWTGGGDLELGGYTLHAAPPPPTLGFGIHGNGSFDYGGAQLNLPPPGAPLFTGVNLAELGVTFALHPTTFTGDATVTIAGGVVTIHGGVLVVNADANEPYRYQPGALPGVNALQTDTHADPITSFAAGVSGTVTLNTALGNTPLASGYVFYISPSYFEFAGNLGPLNLLDVVSVTGGVKGALDTSSGRYDVSGSLTACADFPVVGSVCPGINGEVSSNGIGACGSITAAGQTITGGFSYQWGGTPQILGPFSCDLGPLHVVVRGAAAQRARAASAQGVDLPSGLPSASIWVTGSGGPPQVALRGPRGAGAGELRPGQAFVSRRLVIWPEPKLDQTLIAIRRPAQGRWTVTPLTGSPTITGISYADGLPPARISTTVSGHRRSLTLHYRIRPRAGQSVTFAERADGVFHILGRAHANRGSLRFTPAPARGGSREIVAIVALSGVPRETVAVGRYAAPPMPKPGKVAHLRISRQRRSLLVSWRAVPGAHGYLVSARLSDGRRLAFSLNSAQRRVRVLPVEPGGAASISVFALDPTGNPGPSTTAAIAALTPARVSHISPRLTHRAFTVAWRPAAHASQYLITLTITGKTRITLYGIAVIPRLVSKTVAQLLRPNSRVLIAIRAVTVDGTKGHATLARFTARGSRRRRRQVARGAQVEVTRSAVAAFE